MKIKNGNKSIKSKIQKIILKLIGVNPAVLHKEYNKKELPIIPVNPEPQVTIPASKKKYRTHNKHMYIYKNEDKNGDYYILQYQHSQWGTYTTPEKAVTVRNFLIYKNWNKQYRPKKVLRKKNLKEMNIIYL